VVSIETHRLFCSIALRIAINCHGTFYRQTSSLRSANQQLRFRLLQRGQCSLRSTAGSLRSGQDFILFSKNQQLRFRLLQNRSDFCPALANPEIVHLLFLASAFCAAF
jgi:hypothetical protein